MPIQQEQEQEQEEEEEQMIQEQELETLDTDSQMQETAVQQIANEPSIEADGTLQEEEDTLFGRS
jgi:hypothetical protein